MKKILIALMLVFLNLHAKEEILIDSANAYTLTMQDVVIKNSLKDKSKAILIFPTVKKVGFVVGGMYGAGVAIVKNSPSWSVYKAEISNASIGFQIGYEDNYLVIYIMDDETLNKVSNSNLKIGVDATASIWEASASAGAVDVFNKNMYAYVNKKGVFAGASIGGSVLKIDLSSRYSNSYYGYSRLMNAIGKQY
ncbi:putative lipid-binding protein (SYLF/DUF500 domain) [Campylobacter blaseri]|uniref:Ysc84 actin-binding domain-containing protein n=1 Tax=Campylobacter blaseri TaxID=2042961 RepID=A0A2P8QZ41_9BACT|nr:lipid-binding SYLF domain-containing protein [Campylobacter blaseri]PSM51516.1 hypothetical protein CQ405_08100 [Campylobacter blaseri]PSM52965.1 hypothetical protein CRN67_08105 [Campylobacter blaseri]QKF86470.1 putative lipid-binding protein (SYLF/DUF500 domain) [Campylobacter blaseri]